LWIENIACGPGHGIRFTLITNLHFFFTCIFKEIFIYLTIVLF
jgi:hypothetical protein